MIYVELQEKSDFLSIIYSSGLKTAHLSYAGSKEKRVCVSLLTAKMGNNIGLKKRERESVSFIMGYGFKSAARVNG